MPLLSRYQKIGDNMFVSIPGTTSIDAPTEEVFDDEVITAARLEVVNEPRPSSIGSKEKQLLRAMSENLQKLQAHHRSRTEGMDSSAAVIGNAEEEFQNRMEVTQILYPKSLQDHKERQR